MTSLAQIQSGFLRYVVSGDNLAAVTDWIGPSRAASVEQRLDVYRNAYWTRLQESLARDFPALLAVAGDRQFGSLATEYLIAQPPVKPSLRSLGAELPQWLHARGCAPVLADLAALEWAVLEAFDAADATIASPRALDGIAPELWPMLKIVLHPAVVLLAMATNARELWSAVRRDAPRAAVRATRERLVVWRSERGPAVIAVADAPFRVLSSLASGDTLADACEALASSMSADRIPGAVAGCLHQALGHGWIAQVIRPTDGSDAGGDPRRR